MPITTRAAGFAIAAIAVTTPAPALAGSAVYGGTTSAGAAIVINADKKAKKLRSAVVSWRASCDDGKRFPVAAQLKAVAGEAGFRPGFRELATSRNGKGRFAGTQLGGFDLGDACGHEGELHRQAHQEARDRHARRDDHRHRQGRRQHGRDLPDRVRALLGDPLAGPRVRRLDVAGPPDRRPPRRRAPQGRGPAVRLGVRRPASRTTSTSTSTRASATSRSPAATSATRSTSSTPRTGAARARSSYDIAGRVAKTRASGSRARQRGGDGRRRAR